MKKRFLPRRAKRRAKRGEEFFTRYALEDGKLREIKVSKKEAMKDIRRLLKRDKDFLEIMEKL